jgi:hypothetical protein
MLKPTFSKDSTLTSTGLVFILLGLTGIYFFVYRGIKPDLLQFNTFTICSKYIQTKLFTFIRNNQGDELAILMYCVGWLLIVFKQKKSLQNKQALAILIFIAGYFFLHGLAVIYFTFIFLFLLPLFFIIK